MDKMYIKDLQIFANHGVLNEEKVLGQKFIISVELSLNLKKASSGDDLNKTVNYAKLCSEIEIQFKKESYDLIETAADRIACYILLNYDQVEEVKVLLKKPWAPIGMHLDYAAVEISRKWHTTYLGLGSNMGDKKKNLLEAIEILKSDLNNKVTKVSDFYETKPVGYLEQDDFINAALELKTLYQPEELMGFLLIVEQQLKRERIIHWGPRTIDLDILLFDDYVTTDEHVILPHPRMTERLFVLQPLCEIAPYALHPLLKKRIIEIKEELE